MTVSEVISILEKVQDKSKDLIIENFLAEIENIIEKDNYVLIIEKEQY
jgi:hypothetical protein